MKIVEEGSRKLATWNHIYLFLFALVVKRKDRVKMSVREMGEWEKDLHLLIHFIPVSHVSDRASTS